MAAGVKPCVAVVFTLFILLSCVIPIRASAEIDPKYGVYVQDGASILQLETQNKLYSQAIWLQTNSGSAQVGIVTIETLDDRPIEDLALAKIRELGLGSKERNDGVLLLYAAKENRVRIEVGYGMEGRIPDGKAGAILDNYFVPYINAGQIDQAFSLTQTAILQEMAAEYNLDPSNANMGVLPDTGADGQSHGFLDGIPGYLKVIIVCGIAILIFLDFKFLGGMMTLSILSLLGRRGNGGGGGGWGGRGGGGSSGGGGASR